MDSRAPIDDRVSTVYRTDHRDAERTWNALWSSIERPAVDVRSAALEEAKVALLAPHLGPVRTVIDCGCGGGDFLDLVAKRGRFTEVVGVDVADNALARAERTGRYATLVRARLDELPEQMHDRFELVLFGEILPYLGDPLGDFTRAVDALTAPRGVVFLATATGHKRMTEPELAEARGLMKDRGFQSLEDRRLDHYTLGALPRRRLGPLSRLWAETHTTVLVWRAPRAWVGGPRAA